MIYGDPRYSNPLAQNQQPEEEEGLFKSVALAPVRGVAGAVAGVANLFGADVQDNFGLGHSQGVGGVVEGITQFLTGFIPIGGALGRIGALSTVGKTGLALAKTAAARGAIASAATDFTVFDGNDPRLSNLIQSVPGLQNPITEFLAASDTDSETWGRLKNVVEGLGVGAIVDPFMTALTRMRRANSLASQGKTAEAKAVADSIPEELNRNVLDDETVEQTLDRMEREEAEAAAEGMVSEGSPVSPQDAPGSTVTHGATQGQPDPRSSNLGQPEPMTLDKARKLVNWDPNGGPVVVVDVNPANRGKYMEGHSSMDALVYKPGSKLAILQLSDQAKVLDGDGMAASALIADLPKNAAKSVQDQAILKAAKKEGYDAVTFTQKDGSVKTTVLNDGAIARRVETIHGRDSHAIEAKAKALRQPDVVAKSPLERALAKAGSDEATTKAAIASVNNAVTAIRTLWAQKGRHFKDTEKAALESKLRGETEDHILGALGGINFSTMPAEHSTIVMRAMMDELRPALEEMAKGDSRTVEEMIQETSKGLKNFLGKSADKMALELQTAAKNVNDYRVLAKQAEIAAHIYAKEAAGLADQIVKYQSGVKPTSRGRDGQPMSIESLMLAFEENRINTIKVAGGAGRLKSAFGRALRSLGGDVGIDALSQNTKINSLINLGGPEAILARAKAFLEDQALGGLGHANRVSLNATTRGGRLTGVALEAYYFSLLSGPKTLTTNVISGMVVQAWEPIERMLGGFIRRIGASPEEIKAIKRENMVNRLAFGLKADMYGQAFRLLGDSNRAESQLAQALGRGFNANGSVLGDAARTMDRATTTGFNADNFSKILGRKEGQEITADSTAGKALSWIGKLIHLPSRIMGAQDELMKFIEAQAHVKAELTMQAEESGLKGMDATTWIEKQMEDMFSGGDLLSREAVERQAAGIYTPDAFPETALEHQAKFVNNRMADQRVDLQTGVPVAGDFVRGREALANRARELAHRVTFTSKIDPNRGVLSSAASKIQHLANEHNSVRVFFPFIRTPMNLLIYAGERMPIPIMNKEMIGFLQYVSNRAVGTKFNEVGNRFVAAISKGGPEAADAWGRATTAMGVLTMGLAAAGTGVLTGKGPSDPEQRALLQAAGWQPYSIKVGDTFVSYQRLDPIASILGIMADFAEIGQWSDEEQGAEMLAWNLWASVMANLESKSYLAGLTDIAGMLHDPINTVQRVSRRITGAVVPNVIASARSFTDPYTTEVRGMLDNIRNRIPFLGNDSVAPARNMLGERVTKKQLEGALATAEGFANYMFPLSVNRTTSDTVTKEMANLGYPFSLPKPQKWGVDLRDYTNEKGQSAFDRWQELIGEVSVGGRKLRPAMERLINSNKYQSLDARDVDSADIDSPRVSKLQGLVDKYRRKALLTMMAEFPQLREHTRARRIASEALQSGEPMEAVRARLFPTESR